jgi:hypothetical protein
VGLRCVGRIFDWPKMGQCTRKRHLKVESAKLNKKLGEVAALLTTWLVAICGGGVLHMHPSSPSHPPFSLNKLVLMKK